VTAPITQKDIARKLGVSVTLVSRVLAGKAQEIGAAAATVESIQQTAAALGYVPNANARILKGAPSRTLGVVVYDFEDPFLGALIGALQRLAHAHDHTLVLVGFEQRRVDAQALRPLSKHGLSGLIVVGSGLNDDWLETFRARRLPVARIGTCPSATQASVTVDSAGGIKALLHHLFRQGIRSAGFVGDTHPAHQERLRCFVAQAAALGITTRPAWQVVRAEPAALAGYEGTRTLIQQQGSTLPRALVAASDAIAIGALRALQEHSIAVPSTMAVTGFDDIPFADLLTPALTTIRQPVQAMAQTAFAWGSGHPPATPRATGRRVLLPGELIVRESA
jgi:DNA-binding LacI/PurR family transcriptional regulator